MLTKSAYMHLVTVALAALKDMQFSIAEQLTTFGLQADLYDSQDGLAAYLRSTTNKEMERRCENITIICAKLRMKYGDGGDKRAQAWLHEEQDVLNGETPRSWMTSGKPHRLGYVRYIICLT